MNWVSVKDSLPKEGGLYLVADNGYVDVADFQGYGPDRKTARWNTSYVVNSTDVTYWMPLPEPPKE